MRGLLVGVCVFAASIAAVAACSGGGAGDGSPGPGTTNGDGIVVPPGSTSPSPTGTVPGPGPGLDDGGTDVDPTVSSRPSQEDPPTPALPSVCSLSAAAFDLTKLSPESSTPPAVVTAWNQAKALAGATPALILAIEQGANVGDAGATPFVSIGSVHASSLVDFVFNDPPAAATNVPMTIDPPTHSLTAAGLGLAFVASFSSDVANGFQGVGLQVAGSVDSFCNNFTGTVVVDIPGTCATTPFGSTTVGAAFGTPTIDTTNGGGAADGWQLVLKGTAPYVAMRATP